MKSPLIPLLFCSALLVVSGCAKHEHHEETAVQEEVRHPFKGEVINVQAEAKSLLVKHEDIPGYMPAMTMMFKVDGSIIQSVKKGDAITGTLVGRVDGFWLEDVKPVTP